MSILVKELNSLLLKPWDIVSILHTGNETLLILVRHIFTGIDVLQCLVDPIDRSAFAHLSILHLIVIVHIVSIASFYSWKIDISSRLNALRRLECLEWCSVQNNRLIPFIPHVPVLNESLGGDILDLMDMDVLLFLL